MGFELGFEKNNFLGNGIRTPPSRPSSKNKFLVNEKAKEKHVKKNFSIFEFVKFSDCGVDGYVDGLK